jgi:hypothetical protein
MAAEKMWQGFREGWDTPLSRGARRAGMAVGFVVGFSATLIYLFS